MFALRIRSAHVLRVEVSDRLEWLFAVFDTTRTNLCRHSLVVMVFFNISRHIGHISSLCKLLGDTAISVPSVIASCGVLCSSYKLNSQVLLGTAAYSILKIM